MDFECQEIGRMEELVGGERMPEVVVGEVVFMVVERVEKMMMVGGSIVEGGGFEGGRNWVSEAAEMLERRKSLEERGR